MAKFNPAMFTADLVSLKQAAEVMRDAVGMIGDNRERLDAVENAVQHIEKQLDSLECRYSELLYRFGELRNG